MEFLRSSLRRPFSGKPMVASSNDSCFLSRLSWRRFMILISQLINFQEGKQPPWRVSRTFSRPPNDFHRPSKSHFFYQQNLYHLRFMECGTSFQENRNQEKKWPPDRASVVQKVDSTIHWITQLVLLDSDLSDGKRCPTVVQPGLA